MPLSVKSAMLADAATLAENKLYVHGGQWDTMATSSLPVRFPSMAVVLVIEVPYDEALEPHQIELTLDLDGRELDAPRAIGDLRTGHGPTSARGAPGFMPLVIPIQNLDLQEAGRYDWLIKIDGEPIARIPMAVQLVPQPPGVPAPPE